MTLYPTHLSAYLDTSIASLNGWIASAELPSIARPPFTMLMGLCVIGLILGGLWVQGRYTKHQFHRHGSKESSAELSATYDYVTGLPTRRLFGTLLEQAIGRAAKTGRSIALLVVELEHFRMVAESQGQANSNVLVRVQAARVKGVLRSTETVARLAQDQFAMIVDHLASHGELTALVERLQATVGLPLTLDGHELFLSCRIGIALYPQDLTQPDGLLELAVEAVRTAKSEGQAVRFTSSNILSAPTEAVPIAASL